MEKIFIEKTKMETQTVFHENGRVSIHPHAYELNKKLLPYGKDEVIQRGRMYTDEEGRSVFHPYRQNSRPPFQQMAATAYGRAKMTYTGAVIVSFRLPQGCGARKLLLKEAKEMAKKL